MKTQPEKSEELNLPDDFEQEKNHIDLGVKSDTKKVKQPKWIKRLEKESWQAELIISGMALYGSFHLPEFIDIVTAFLIKHLQVDLYYIGYTITYLLLLGISAITVFFTVHFVYRAYWVGLIGLNSVFPEGIRLEGGMYSPRFLQKAKEDLPEIKDSIQNLDKICSTIFSGAFAFAMFGLGCTITIGFALILTVILSKYFAIGVAMLPFYILIICYLLATCYFIYGNRKSKWDDDKAQDRLYKLSSIFSLIFMNVFNKPVSQIMSTFYSYYDKKDKSTKKKGNLPVLFFILTMIYLLILFTNSDVPLFFENRKNNFSNTMENTVQNMMYKDQNTYRSGVLNPVIPSEIIESGFVKLFVPVLPNESVILNEVCGKFKRDKALSRDKNVALKTKFKLECFESTHQVEIDNKAVNAEFIFHEYPHSNEEGFLCFIPTSSLSEGKHLISVKKFSDSNHEVIDQEFLIPFWFAP